DYFGRRAASLHGRKHSQANRLPTYLTDIHRNTRGIGKGTCHRPHWHKSLIGSSVGCNRVSTRSGRYVLNKLDCVSVDYAKNRPTTDSHRTITGGDVVAAVSTVVPDLVCSSHLSNDCQDCPIPIIHELHAWRTSYWGHNVAAAE